MALFTFRVRVRVKDFMHQGHPDNQVIELTSAEVQKRIASHIRDAVQCWGGQFHPGDVLFGKNVTQVTARPEDIELSKVEQMREANVIEHRKTRPAPKQRKANVDGNRPATRKGRVYMR